jgi:unsaturated chondroitin disaccharide hydrolase
MIRLDNEIKPIDLASKLRRLWELSARKIQLIEDNFDESKGSPVFTARGKYTARGWTEWTQGFQYGSAILHWEATGEKRLLERARENIMKKMAPHISHTGSHDHGFNIVSTYGNLLRQMHEGKIVYNQWEREYYELALKISGAVQASRWTNLKSGGFVHSFNGPHSLFVDTIRSCRLLIISHLLGHFLKGEGDIKINLLERALQHMEATASYSVFYGEGRDSYDIRGRTAHECIFNVKDGSFRCPNSQQGYSGFSTWTRGLAWAICGFSEILEWIDTAKQAGIILPENGVNIHSLMLKAATATCDFYIENSPADGVPYWDTGAPDLFRLGDWLEKPADPFNMYEPVDSSAAAIASQGFLRLGRYLNSKGQGIAGNRYWQAGLKILSTLLEEPYISLNPDHQGLLLHSIYHRPNGWDYIPEGSKIPNGESGMWGDYHLREVCLYLQRINNHEDYLTFYNGIT